MPFGSCEAMRWSAIGFSPVADSDNLDGIAAALAR